MLALTQANLPVVVGAVTVKVFSKVAPFFASVVAISVPQADLVPSSFEAVLRNTPVCSKVAELPV
jgi:hypothetical protein